MDEVELDPAVASIRTRFEAEYRVRYGKASARGLYRGDDWARLSFCHAKLAEVGGSALDVGVGPGGLLNILRTDPRFSHVVGIDIRHYSKLVKLSDDMDIRIMDVGAMTFADAAFDVVACMEVLEHLESEHFDRALAELRRVTAKRLFLTVPLREPLPLPPYHKQRFDFDDVAAKFPSAALHLLVRRQGPSWLAVIEDF